MRYLVQFLVPVAIVVLVAWGVLKSRRKAAPTQSDDTRAFILILAIGAAVAIALFVVLGTWLEPA